MLRRIFLLITLLPLANVVKSQFLMDTPDTTNYLSFSESYGGVAFSGYMQPQFQVAQKEGIESFIGGNFDPKVNNRFMLRRGRIRMTYLYFSKDKAPDLEFAFQFDGTERGVNIRDFWGRIHENNIKHLSFTIGMFARPFSYEVNRSSVNRESPERGRLTQLLMKSERDIGAMLSLDARTKESKLRFWKLDVGVFNGQGLATTKDFDSHKDLIVRLRRKPKKVFENIEMSGAVSWLNGGILQNTPYVYETSKENSRPVVKLDSSITNVGKIAPRDYYGADFQTKFFHKAGATELRMEYVFGKHTSTQFSTETPTFLFTRQEPYYIRSFDGAFIYLLHNIFNKKHQLVFKYDFYDPNTKVSGKQVRADQGFTAADVRYDNFGAGYIYYLNEHLKVTAWYDHPINEKTSIPGMENDLKDDVFTLRLQFMF